MKRERIKTTLALIERREKAILQILDILRDY